MGHKKLHFITPEVFVSTPDQRVLIHRGILSKNYRKLFPKVYTTNLTDSLEDIIFRNLWPIVAHFFPDGLIVDRTAFEFKPSGNGTIYLISNRTRELKLPGNITIKPRKGLPALASDSPFISGLKVCSLERAFLENLIPLRMGVLKRTLSMGEIEEKLETILKNNPENGLRQLRKNAEVVSSELGMEKEYEKLTLLTGGLLGTQDVDFLSPVAQARKYGRPYDVKRVELFQKLMVHLLKMVPISRISKNIKINYWKNISFFESYFSNFIEGTEFDVSEASEIIFEGKVPIDRPEDAHDIIGTYQLVSSIEEMKVIPKTYEDFVKILKYRHQRIMSLRPSVSPGEFKTKINRAGATFFVDPELVKGTLKMGFDLYKLIEVPFQRAVFMHFLISEVHPFTDGNGRLSRIMMNAELISKGEERIIIPTIFRGNYLSALGALSNNGIPDPIIRTLDFAQRYVSLVNWENFDQALLMLTQTNAFLDSAKAEVESIRLKLPDYM